MKKEYCGIFAIYGNERAARMTYFGLYALQHRGQECAGIVTWDGQKSREQRGMGLVAEIFTERHLEHELKGNIAVGHVRYSTAGASLIRNAQPFTVRHGELEISIAHNGNLINALELRRELESQGAIFQSTMDTEVIAHYIVKYLQKADLEEAVRRACSHIKGAFSLVILVNDTMIALRDPNGIRPLSMGKLGNSYVFASETCAFDIMDATYLRDLEQSEMVIIEKGKIRSAFLREKAPKKQCIFELVYFARPDSQVFDLSVYGCRKRMGEILAQESAGVTDIDYVLPFPSSGNYAAVGYAQEAKLPLELAMIRNNYVGRTFIQPTQEMRDFSVNMKLNPVKDAIKGKKILIVEDSIVRGTTVRTRINRLKDCGAKEIHLRVSCPPVKFPCYYGIDFSSKGELIAANHTVEEIAKFIGLDSLHYLSVEGLQASVPTGEDFCYACFTGEYPIDYSGELCRMRLDK